jgi:signal transduction histidine kinase
MSVRAQLTIVFTALFGAIVIALALSLYFLQRNDANRRLDTALQVATGATSMSAEHELTEHSTKAAGEADIQSVLSETQSAALRDTQILVCEGERCSGFKSGLERHFDLRRLPKALLRNGAVVDGFRISTRTFTAPKFHTAYQVYAAKPIAPVLAQLEQMRTALLIFVPLGLAVAGIAGYVLATRSLRPLHELARVIEDIGFSDLSARAKVNAGRGEIALLGSRFNALLDRLQQAFDLQRRFMADASHQLRTPISIALAAAQVTNRDPNPTAADYKESLQIVENQMLQVRRAVEDMFFLSQADSASLKIDSKEVYLDDAIAEAVRAAKPLAAAKRQTVKINSLPEAKCTGDSNLLTQAVLVLLDNAVKFTPAEGSIEVSLFRRGADWICSVSDTGIGIAGAAQPRIFDRFFRETKPDSEFAKGAGLGLAIATSIVESHSGTLQLVESRPGRTVFEVAVPARDGEAASPALQANSLAVRM